MLTTLEDIRNHIVRHYDPERIILFGSRADGSANNDSDYDILVIKESHKRPADRRMEVERLLAERTIAIDLIVYTPDEIRTLYAIGSPFIEEIIERGKVLYMRKNTQIWLNDAREELKSARLLFEHEHYKASCYHSQQSAEKALKSLIIEKGEKPDRIHDVIGLANRAKSCGWDIDVPIDDLVFLNSIYKSRYPTEEGLLPHGVPTKEDAQQSLAAAENIFSKVTLLIG